MSAIPGLSRFSGRACPGNPNTSLTPACRSVPRPLRLFGEYKAGSGGSEMASVWLQEPSRMSYMEEEVSLAKVPLFHAHIPWPSLRQEQGPEDRHDAQRRTSALFLPARHQRGCARPGPVRSRRKELDEAVQLHGGLRETAGDDGRHAGAALGRHEVPDHRCHAGCPARGLRARRAARDGLCRRPDRDRAGRVLLDGRTIAKMLDAADLEPGDVVLEIGCGLGYCTALLAHIADAVVAVEQDERSRRGGRTTCPITGSTMPRW
jgi:hypothetical protein